MKFTATLRKWDNHTNLTNLCGGPIYSPILHFLLPASMLQHILNQNPIPPACILHKHMCHRSCQLPILYERRTAHE